MFHIANGTEHIHCGAPALIFCVCHSGERANSIEMWRSSRKLQMRATNCELPFHLLKLNWTKKYNRRNIRQHTHTVFTQLRKYYIFVACISNQCPCSVPLTHVLYTFSFDLETVHTRKYINIFYYLSNWMKRYANACLCAVKIESTKRQWSQRAWSRAPRITHSHSGAANKFCGVRCMWCNWLKV